MEVKREDWWATPVWYFDIPKDIVDYDLISDDCYAQRQLDSNGRAISNIGGWQSNDIFLSDQNVPKNIINLMNVISERSACCFEDFGTKSELNPRLSNFWININSSNSYNKLHTHPKAILSGVYYSKTPENSGGIFFHKPAELDYLHQTYTNCDNSLTFSGVIYTPVPGRVVIFPAWVGHSVQPNNSDNDRISVAFNFIFS
jgi:uncharacterized protein (TIGR02466 family)